MIVDSGIFTAWRLNPYTDSGFNDPVYLYEPLKSTIGPNLWGRTTWINQIPFF
jgi:hypothetical protein